MKIALTDEWKSKLVGRNIEPMPPFPVKWKIDICDGFRIYNAIRGGKLEAFERVNFDELCKQEGLTR